MNLFFYFFYIPCLLSKLNWDKLFTMEKEDSEFEIIDMEKEAESPASIPEGR